MHSYLPAPERLGSERQGSEQEDRERQGRGQPGPERPNGTPLADGTADFRAADFRAVVDSAFCAGDRAPHQTEEPA